MGINAVVLNFVVVFFGLKKMSYIGFKSEIYFDGLLYVLYIIKMGLKKMVLSY